MNKKLIGYTYVFLVFILAALFVDMHKRDEQTLTYLSSTTAGNVSTYASNSTSKSISDNIEFDARDFRVPSKVNASNDTSDVNPVEMQVQQVAVASTQTTLSRGGSGIDTSEADKAVETTKSTEVKKSTAAKKTTKTSKVNSSVELLDWWKAGKSAFPIGAVAEVKDVKTGKTFKIKRTMGSNHADCEALTKEDTQIIKSIWGGFSWDTRPVILTVGNRRLAASMSSLPHAGVDSAPFGAVVNNRSEGYGTGQNLDAVKGNGMNGHFDVHFLNSTRHKDGKVDPRHQAAIAVAARQ